MFSPSLRWRKRNKFSKRLRIRLRGAFYVYFAYMMYSDFALRAIINPRHRLHSHNNNKTQPPTHLFGCCCCCCEFSMSLHSQGRERVLFFNQRANTRAKHARVSVDHIGMTLYLILRVVNIVALLAYGVASKGNDHRERQRTQPLPRGERLSANNWIHAHSQTNDAHRTRDTRRRTYETTIATTFY